MKPNFKNVFTGNFALDLIYLTIVIVIAITIIVIKNYISKEQNFSEHRGIWQSRQKIQTEKN